MDNVSMFMRKDLQELFKQFSSDLEKHSVSDAIGRMKELSGFNDSAMQNNPEEMINYICDEYGVKYDEAAFFMQECGREISEHYYGNFSISDSREVITTIRDTNIPTGMKNDLCVNLATEAISGQDKDMLEIACIQSDGMSFAEYEQIRERIASEFGNDEAMKLDLIMQTKENPVNAAKEWKEGMERGEISTNEYITAYASMMQNMPEHYKEELNANISTSEIQDNQFAIHINAGIPEYEQIEIKISDQDEKLSIGKNDAVELIQHFHIKGDNALDVISEVNIPPTNPNFASELAQKFSNYVSAQSVSAGNPSKNKHAIASILPDDQKATFESFVDDIMKEQRQQVQGHLNANDRDFDGTSDIIPTDEFYEANESTGYAVSEYDYDMEEEDIEI